MALIDRNFVAGEVYFIVMYEDENLLVPVIQTLVFVESRLDEHGKGIHFFRDLSASKDAERFHVREEQVEDLLLDRQGLVRALDNCFARGNKYPG